MPPSKKAARRVVVTQDDDGEDVESTTVGGNGDEDETPEIPAPPKMKTASKIRAGMSAAQQVMDSTSQFAQALKPEERLQIIKFMEDAPYASYKRHWIERAGANSQRSLRSYTCLDSVGEECPLCEILADRPQAVSAWNVAVCGDDGVPSLKSWDVTPKVFNILKGYASDPKVAPLTKGYFAVSRTGKGGTTNHQVIPVKASALVEDYDTPVPDQDELDRLRSSLYTADIVEIPKASQLREIAIEQSDDYG